MKKMFPILMVLLFVTANIRTAAQNLRHDEKIESVRSQISAMNLINGMYMTKDQLVKYVNVLKDKRDLDVKYQEKLDKLKSGLTENFEKLLNEVGENKGISKETQEKSSGIHKDEKELLEDYKLKLIDMESSIESSLTENQMCIIDDFKPCLIPTKNLRDPARVGQAKGDASREVSALEKIKDVPPKRYPKIKEKFIEKYIEEYEKKIAVLSGEDKEKEKNHVASVLDNVRSMTKVDFEMNKEKLGQELLLDKMKPAKRKKYDLGKAGRTLLETGLIPILEKRIAQMN